MSKIALPIYYDENSEAKLRCTVDKWKFQDSMMGEQFITFTVTSERPIPWAIGDYCVFRGETFTLNYVPSVTQKGRTNDRLDAYTYESVKFEGYQEELTRIIMLDITPTTGDYVAALGTNYTGSSKFQLFCGETIANGDTLTAVCALAAKIQANLDRAFTTNVWKIFVDTTSTYVNASGRTVLVTHTEDKVLSFDKNTIAQALAEVHNTFDLDYCIRGRNIYIGYNLKNLTSDNDNETFVFGYGKGYPTREDSGKALFQIKRIANSQQKIVTRLRALGSTKNLPYRYYNRKYNLPQTLFPTNLQLPDTFSTPSVKNTHNATRDTLYGINALTNLPYIRHVKGDTNDAYIDKNDDADTCSDGIREDSARWDGSNSDLPEIYPTIEEATFGDLRGASVADQDGNTGNGSFPNYGNDERIDKLLAVGYNDGNTLVDDANQGDGILPESGISSKGVPFSASIGSTCLYYNTSTYGSFNNIGNMFVAPERTLFTQKGVMPGKYGLSPTMGAVIYGFQLSCHRDGCSCYVGYIIKVKQKNVLTGSETTIANYESYYVSIARADGIKEVEIPAIPGDVNATQNVSEIRVTALSDITITFAPVLRNITVPSGFTDNFAIVYQLGNSRLNHDVTNEPEITWFPVDDSNNIVDRFHVFVQDMGFDFDACWSDDTPVLAMKSGSCVGREFEILEDVEKVTYGNKKGYMLTLKRAEDSSLGTYYPSQTDPIAAGDHFVLLGIQMPDAYVQMAEVRLLRAASDYLSDNSETQFTYQPYIDDIYLQRNYDKMVEAGTPEKSIFWRLYAGLKFTFRGIPSSANDPLPLADLTIKQVTISMGDGLTPKVEMTLNDDVQQTTLQKLTTSIDRIYNGSLFSSGSGGVGTGANAAALLSILQSEGGKLFLSKKQDDVAEGKITFNDVVTHQAVSKFKKGLRVGNFNSRLLGSGALIDEEGNAEFESIYTRNFISTPEFRFNRIAVTDGEQWCTNGYGTIQEVEITDATTGYITLKLEENDYASIAVGDICRGIYNDIANEFETASLDDDSPLYASQSEGDGFGFSSKAGFFTSYFWVKAMVVNRRGECKFQYELRNTNTPHPCVFMKFAQYGSFTNANRRSSSYATSIGHYYEMVLDGVSTWKIQSANVVYRKGYLGNMTVELHNGREAQLQGYGLYVQDNVYFGNAVVQLDPETLAELEESLKSYNIDFSGYVDVITVDDVGNCIGGLWTASGQNGEYRNYRIHSAISVRKNDTLLTIAADDEDAGEGTYKIYAEPHGCTCIIENSTIYITGITNIKDGVPGSPDDANFDYDAMRAMDSCSVDIIIDCEGNGSIQKNFPIRIKHDSQPFVNAHLDNMFSSVSWNTKTQAYVGLPISTNMRMWHNADPLNVTAISVNGVSGADSTQTTKVITVSVNGVNITMTTSLVTITENGSSYVVGRVQIASLPASLSLVTNLNITTTALYSGVSYERTLVHTINKSTDTNVYSLLPSVGEIVYDKNTNTLSANSVTCDVICDSSDENHYIIPGSTFSTHKLSLVYRKYYVDGTSDANYTTYVGTAVPVTSSVKEVKFTLYGITNGVIDTSIVHDTQSVYILSNGEDGVSYIIESYQDGDACDHLSILSDDASVDLYLSLKFFTEKGGVRSSFSCYSQVYTRSHAGTLSLLYNGTSTKSSMYSISRTGSHAIGSDIAAIVVYISNSSSNLTDSYLSFKEIPVIKHGDTGAPAVEYFVEWKNPSCQVSVLGCYDSGQAKSLPLYATLYRREGDVASIYTGGGSGKLVCVNSSGVESDMPSSVTGNVSNSFSSGDNMCVYVSTTDSAAQTALTSSAVVRAEFVITVDGVQRAISSELPKSLDGNSGSDGSDGVFPRDCGMYDVDIATHQTYGYAGYIYRKVNDMVIRDKVNYEIGGVMYGFLVKSRSQTALVTAAPTSANGDDNWESAGIVRTIIANTIFGTNANIGGFMASSQQLISTSMDSQNNPNLHLNGSTGELTALKANIKGTVYAESGVFRGFVYKKKVRLSDLNLSDYLVANELGFYELDLELVGGFLYFEGNLQTVSIMLPSIYPDVTTYSSAYKERVRSLIGNTILVYNASAGNITLTGRLKASPSSSPVSIVLSPNECACLTCQFMITGGYEDIYWLFEKGNIR